MIEKRMISVGTPTALRYAELAAFERDLQDSLDALKAAAALSTSGQDDSTSLQQHLIFAGVISYWRCFPTWPTKPRLTRHVRIPDDIYEVHKDSRAWRNKVVAHTDSGMKRSIALVQIDKSGTLTSARCVARMSLEIRPDADAITGFTALVERMNDVVAVKLSELGNQLLAELGPQERLALWERPDFDGPVDPAYGRWSPAAERRGHFVSMSFPINSD